jgi:hypothetical protein
METIEVSVNLADMLRKSIDEITNFKRTAAIDQKIIADYTAGKPLSEAESQAIKDYMYGRILTLFLDAREALTIPDDALHRLASELQKKLGQLGITFRYEEFYAYQFVDKLDEIVRRARRVRDVFTKQSAPPNVTVLCREAYQAYVNGHFTASVALVRSLIESTLKSQLKVEFGELGRLNDLAVQKALYPNAIWHKVHQIRKQANAILHGAASGKIASEVDSLRLIGFAQEVLQAIHP